MKKYKFPYCGCEFQYENGKMLFDPDNIPLDCKLTWELISSGNTKGVFQLESHLGQSYAAKLKPNNIEHLAALSAIIRPGVMEVIIDGKTATERYIDRKNGKEKAEPFHESLKDILADTYQCLIYQESTSLIAKDLAGFDLVQADNLRKCIEGKSLVHTNRGEIPIKELAQIYLEDGPKHYLIYTVDKNDKPAYLPIKHVWCSGKKTCLKISTQTRDIRVTGNHQIYTENRGWIDASFLTAVDILCTTDKWGQIHKEQIRAIEHEYELYDTYDYEVDHPTVHYGFVNGILVHNSIGKKKADLMAKVKVEFVDGCVDKGVVSKKDAEEIFGWIERSARYLFNKSLLPNTLCQTKDGEKTIDELNIGELINTPTGWAKVKGKFEHGVLPVWKVILESGKQITCTAQHKFLCERNKILSLYRILYQGNNVVTDDGLEKIISIHNAGKQRTVDIEIENDNHIFYGNNIATSNSHAVGYAMQGYLTAYCKAHFKRAFFTSYLYYAENKQDTAEEKKRLIQNAKLMDVEVLPPDIRKRNHKFKLIDKKIYFGLRDIKGVGKSEIAKIDKRIEQAEKNLNKPIDNFTWLEFLLTCGIYINATAIRAIICSGALSYFGMTRRRMVHETILAGQLKEREIAFGIKYAKSGDRTLIDLLRAILEAPTGRKDPLAVCSMDKRKDQVQSILQLAETPGESMEDTVPEIAGMEETLFGVSITCTQVEGCDISNANCTIKDFLCSDIFNKNAILIACQVDEIKELITKNGKNPGQKMCKISVSDITGELESVMMWPDIYEKYRNRIYEGATIMINGEKDRKKDSQSFIVKNIWEIA